jgi:hypothetical protein
MADCTKDFTNRCERLWECVTRSSEWQKFANIPQRIKDSLLDTTLEDI